MLTEPTTVVSPPRPPRFFKEPLLEIETLPPTHCSRSSPLRVVRAVLLIVRSPLMHVVPALLKASMLLWVVMVSDCVVVDPVQSVGVISVPHVPAVHVAGPAVVGQAAWFAHVVPQLETSFRFTSQLLSGLSSQSRKPPAQGKQTPLTQVCVVATHATGSLHAPWSSQV